MKACTLNTNIQNEELKLADNLNLLIDNSLTTRNLSVKILQLTLNSLRYAMNEPVGSEAYHNTILLIKDLVNRYEVEHERGLI